jgi:hypothetical protein
MAQTFLSRQVQLLPGQYGDQARRIDIEFQGVDHSGHSYEARVYLNNPAADLTTASTEADGYIGSFWVFGHGGCFGDTGHCDVPSYRAPYDRRPPHQLSPAIKRVVATDPIKRAAAAGGGAITLTVVPHVQSSWTGDPDPGADVLGLSRVSIISYG